MTSSHLLWPRRRILWLQALLLLVFLGLAARAGHLVLDERARDRGANQRITVIKIPPERGAVLDRNFRELAVSIPAPSVFAIPSEMSDPRAVGRRVAEILELDPEAVADRLANRQRFTYVKRWVAPEKAEALAKSNLPGIGIVNEPRRTYPSGLLAGRILGFTNIDGQGVRGIEQQEDDFLRGQQYSVKVVRDARGSTLKEPRNQNTASGGEIALTLDGGLQAHAEAALRDAVARSGARGGTVLSLDPETGEILVLAEAPGLDPNHFRSLDYDSTGSSAFQDAVEPGSTMKVFLVAGALDAETLTPDDVIDCSGGEYPVPGKTIRDHHDYGVLDPAGVLRHSSNVGSVQIAEALGRERHHRVLERFGFGEPTGSDFPHESSGLLRNWRNWKPIDHATIAFGQGISVTAIQLAAAMGALANDGEWLRPRLVKGRREAGGRWRETPVDRVRQSVSAEAAHQVLRMMQGVVSGRGTGRLAGLRGVAVAGKTGTAQKFDRESMRYSKDRYIAWFMGAVPAEDPQFVIVTALDEPQGLAHGGGDVAAPLFAKIATAHLARVGIATEPRAEARVEIEIVKAAPPTPARPDHISPAAPTQKAARVLLSDLRGLSRHEVARYATDHALELRSEGRGHAFEQTPSPGTILAGPRPRVFVRFRSENREG